MSEQVKEYHIVNVNTGETVGKAKKIERARSIRDRKDNEYGGYCHTVKPSFGGVE